MLPDCRQELPAAPAGKHSRSPGRLGNWRCRAASKCQRDCMFRAFAVTGRRSSSHWNLHAIGSCLLCSWGQQKKCLCGFRAVVDTHRSRGYTWRGHHGHGNSSASFLLRRGSAKQNPVGGNSNAQVEPTYNINDRLRHMGRRLSTYPHRPILEPW
jgi:hypothetical protein